LILCLAKYFQALGALPSYSRHDKTNVKELSRKLRSNISHSPFNYINHTNQNKKIIWDKLATSHKHTLDLPQFELPCEELLSLIQCGFGIKVVIFLGLQRCTSKTKTLYNSNLQRITTFQKHICFENVAPISYNSQRYLCN
jgi:hypothetical protein